MIRPYRYAPAGRVIRSYVFVSKVVAAAVAVHEIFEYLSVNLA